MLERGFWLYVWRIEVPIGEFLYVGRTGDALSPHANPPYIRMGQHLGRAKTQNALRRQLEKRGIAPEACTRFDFIAHGPLYPATQKQAAGSREAAMAEHSVVRDLVAPMEKALADELSAAGYEVLNTVHCKKPLDQALWAPVRNAFAEYFPRLSAE